MTTRTREQRYERYKADFLAFMESANGPAWLKNLRGRGFAAFDRVGLPVRQRGNENWKYTNLLPLANTVFEYPTRPGSIDAGQLASLAPISDDWIELVFVDGRYVRELSRSLDRSGAVAGNLGDVVEVGANGVGEAFGGTADVESDGFTALNTAFTGDAAVVKLPPNGAAPPIHLVFVTTDHAENIATHPRTLVDAGPESACTVVESYVGVTDSTYFTNSVSEIILGPGARMEHYRLMMDSPNAYHIGSTPVRLGDDSSFTSLSFARGGRIARNGLRVMLDAPGSSCTVSGLYYTTGTQHIDNHIVIDHLKPRTSSDLYFKGILDDRSRAVFSGGVIVHPNAQKSEAYQKDQNLLLSEGARINTKPMLEIYADDIQATHGATAGAMADEAIFYMRSRGIDEEVARRLLVHGFAKEIVDRVALEPLRTHVDRLFAAGP